MGEPTRDAPADDRASGAGPRSAGQRSTRVRRPAGRRPPAAPPSTGPATEYACPADPTRPSIGPLDYHPGNPSRPPDWRWRRGSLLADGFVRPSRRRDEDEWVLRSMRFQSAMRACRGEDDHEALMERMPDLYAAHSVYVDAAPRWRWWLKAYILSGETFETTAKRFRIEEATVAAIEKLYFDVIDHAGTDFVPLVAAEPFTGRTSPCPGATLLWFAYHGGPWVLDFLIGTDTDLIKPDRPEQVDEFAENYVRDGLLKTVAVAARSLRVDSRSAMKLVNIYLGVLQDEQRVGGPDSTLDAIRPNVEAVWDSLPSSLKTEGESPRPVTPANGTNPWSDGVRL